MEEVRGIATSLLSSLNRASSRDDLDHETLLKQADQYRELR